MRSVICVPCGLTMKPKRNGTYAVEYMDSEKTQPYKLWMSDMLACPNCDTSVLQGWGNAPVREHFDPDFQDVVNDVSTESEVIRFY